jgi:hypothetical protein
LNGFHRDELETIKRDFKLTKKYKLQKRFVKEKTEEFENIIYNKLFERYKHNSNIDISKFLDKEVPNA